MKKVFAMLLIIMILAMSFTCVAYADTDLDDWRNVAGAQENSDIKSAAAEVSGIGLAIEYVMNNAFKMLVTIVVTWVAIKLLFAKSGQSADTSKQKIMFAIIAVLIYVLGVPILNLLGNAFSGVFN